MTRIDPVHQSHFAKHVIYDCLFVQDVGNYIAALSELHDYFSATFRQLIMHFTDKLLVVCIDRG